MKTWWSCQYHSDGGQVDTFLVPLGLAWNWIWTLAASEEVWAPIRTSEEIGIVFSRDYPTILATWGKKKNWADNLFNVNRIEYSIL